MEWSSEAPSPPWNPRLPNLSLGLVFFDGGSKSSQRTSASWARSALPPEPSQPAERRGSGPGGGQAPTNARPGAASAYPGGSPGGFLATARTWPRRAAALPERAASACPAAHAPRLPPSPPEPGPRARPLAEPAATLQPRGPRAGPGPGEGGAAARPPPPTTPSPACPGPHHLLAPPPHPRPAAPAPAPRRGARQTRGGLEPRCRGEGGVARPGRRAARGWSAAGAPEDGRLVPGLKGAPRWCAARRRLDRRGPAGHAPAPGAIRCQQDRGPSLSRG